MHKQLVLGLTAFSIQIFNDRQLSNTVVAFLIGGILE